jgi:hypothetical protein
MSQAEPTGFVIPLGADSGFHPMVVIIWSLASWCRKKQHSDSHYTNVSEGAQAPFSFLQKQLIA